MKKWWIALVGLLLIPAAAYGQPKNVLFYGNSFTLGFGSTSSVNSLFSDIALAAGQESPLAQSAAASGQDIHWHVNNNASPIFTSIPPDRNWDFIVMQEHSTKLTRAYAGSPAFPASVEQSKQNVVDLLEAAQMRSPQVVPVLYETWARGPGHSFYAGNPPLFADPSEMQAEVRSGYDMLKDAIDASLGTDLALIAPVGDAWENANYERLHASDQWHAQNRGTLLAALVIYGTVYEDYSTSDIDLDGVLASLGLSAADGEFLTSVADATLIPEPAACILACMACASPMLRRRRR